MPWPSSATSMTVPSSSLDTAMSKWPRSAIASRLLEARFSSIRSNWLRSKRIGAGAAGSAQRSTIRASSNCRSIGCKASTAAAASKHSTCSASRRLKRSSRRTMVMPRSADASTAARLSSSCAMRCASLVRSSSWRAAAKPDITARMLLKSCARPLAMRSVISRFCAWISWVCARSRSCISCCRRWPRALDSRRLSRSASVVRSSSSATSR
ncbi:hypothetical protein NB713_003715 [Xanthomonas sacchari]|nr:hypothetical protein [Xanthomonas sacchari]